MPSFQPAPATPTNSFQVMHLILNLDLGGAQEVVRTLAKCMAQAGQRPVVCTFKDGPLRPEIERLGVPVEVLPDRRYSILLFPLFILDMLRIRADLLRLLRKYQIDVLQTHLLQSLDFLVASLYFMKDRPLIYWTIHNYNFTLQPTDLPRHPWLLGPKRWGYRLLYRLSIGCIDGLIAVSADVKDAILKTIGPVESKISVICNGVDTQRYHQPVDKGRVRRELGLAEDVHLALVVATLKEQKGHCYLIEAVAQVVPHYPDLHLLFAGDGVLRDSLQAQAQALHLQDHIHFLGNREDIPDLLAASDCFILPSLWEGLAMALIEAMASGLPVIATQVSGSNQVMIPDHTGLLVPPGDAQALARAMLALFADPERAAHMGLAAQQRVEEAFSAREQAAAHLALYRQGSNARRLHS